MRREVYRGRYTDDLLALGGIARVSFLKKTCPSAIHKFGDARELGWRVDLKIISAGVGLLPRDIKVPPVRPAPAGLRKRRFCRDRREGEK